MIGNHCIKTYSQTQETVALSSGELEFYGIVKAATMCLGMKGLIADLEMKVQITRSRVQPSALHHEEELGE